MKYDPQKHHRRSIRLQGYDYTSPGAYFITICTHQRQCLFGEIVDGEMQLNEFGIVARSHWMKLPQHHSHLQLDAFVVMPNHVHGILVLTDRVGAGFDTGIGCTDTLSAKPAPTDVSVSTKRHGIPEIIRGFKTFSARRINQMRKVGAGFDTGIGCTNTLSAKPAPTVWQRNYYEHIIRNDIALAHIQQYIDNNPRSWQQDQLHPNNPSKW